MEILSNGLRITYYGHSTFEIQSSSGKTVFIDPWIRENPMCPDHLKQVKKADIIAVTHGHFDHISDVIPIAKEHNPNVIANFEICGWLGSKGVENCAPMNKGGTQEVEGIKFTMTHAQHSSGINEEDGSIIYGGEPGGYVIEFENNYKIYHAGDTNLFSDMKLIAELYKPDLVMIPIGDHFTMDPLEASYACRYLSARYVIPMHYATFPLLTGTPEELERLTSDLSEVEILKMNPGDILS